MKIKNRRTIWIICGVILAVVVLAIGTWFIIQQGVNKRQAQTAAVQSTIQTVSPSQLSVWLQQKDFTLINVHTPYAGELDQTDAFIPYDRITNGMAGLPADKNAKIVVYCRSGRMSRIAAETLVKLGYKNVFDLQGGMNAWTAAGYTIQQQPGRS